MRYVLVVALQAPWAITDSAQYLRYAVEPSRPLPPVEPFTVARLRSNAERLYTVARPAWEGFGQTVGDVCLWRSKTLTITIILVCAQSGARLMWRQIYSLLVVTSTLLPALFLLPLYPLLKHRFFPASARAQYQDSLEAKRRSEEIADLADELIEDGVPVQEGHAAGSGFPIGVDLGRARKELDLAREGTGMSIGTDDETAGLQTGKKGEGRRKIRRRLRELEEEYGAGIVVVLGDLAVSGGMKTLR